MASKEQTITQIRYIRQKLKLDQFETAALVELQKAYSKASLGVAGDIVKAYKKNYANMTQDRLAELQDEIQNTLEAITEELTAQVATAAGEAGAYSYKDTNDIVSWDNTVPNYNHVALSAGQIAALVTKEKLGDHTLDGWLHSALNAENKALKTEIQAAMARGKGYKAIMDELGSRYDNLFNSKAAKQNLETVVKSYIQATNAKAHKDIYEANEDVIDGVEWSAIMENGNTKTGRGTCPRCQGLDGQEYETVKEGPICPLHARCRCMYLPITKSWAELGIDMSDREDLDKRYNVEKWYERDQAGNIIDQGTIEGNYADLWETKPPWWQDNAIGKTKAQMVRDDIIDFEDIAVYSEAYQKSLKKLTGRSYKLGDQVTIADLNTWSGNVPVKKVIPIPPVKKVVPPAPTVVPLGAPSAEALFSSAPSVYKSAYQRRLLEVDTGYVVEKKEPSQGAYYQPRTKYINQDPLQTSKKSSMTFLHEYGHRADCDKGEVMAAKWGGALNEAWGTKMASHTTKYNDAINKDRDNLRATVREDYRLLGGTGQASTRKLDRLKEDMKTEFRKELPPYGDTRVPFLKNLAEKEVSGDNIQTLAMAEKFIFDKRKHSLQSYQEIGREQRFEDIYTGIILNQRTGADTFILQDVLDAFNFANKPEDDTAHMIIADAIGATTTNKFGWGHSDSYYNSGPWYRGLEAFANIFAVHEDETSRTVLKRYLPEQVGLFKEFIDEV